MVLRNSLSPSNRAEDLDPQGMGIGARPSVSGARWVFPAISNDKIERMMRDYAMPEIVARLLSARKIEPDAAQSFLYPTLAKDLPHPFVLKDMEPFARYLAESIMAGRSIAAFCDFDVDGSTSAALLRKFFRALGYDLPIYIPDRAREGYGPNAQAMKTLKDQGAEIILMADCGTTAFEVIEYARSIGLEVSIFDHHEQGETLPRAHCVINPKRRDDRSGLSMLAAVGVTFMACVAVNSCLKECGFYEQNNLTPPVMKDFLDLVALGTVCDMVPLTGVNRLLVKSGLLQMAQTKNIGLKALCEVSGVKRAPTVMDMGFSLGPRINAGSRVHRADLGAQLLSCDDAEEAKNIAWSLNDCNAKRKSIQAEMMSSALKMIEDRALHDHPLIMVADEGWHVGLNGLVAGQIKERYAKPACCIAFAPGMSGALEGRGSGRSVKGFNMAALFMAAKAEGLLLKGGGHAMAAGFTVEPHKIPDLYQFFITHAAELAGAEETGAEEYADGIATIRGLKTDFVRILEQQVGPFGMENPEPRFILAHIRVLNAERIGEDHIRTHITDIEGGSRIKAMAFRALGTPLGDLLLHHNHRPIHLLGSFKVNEWNGLQSVEFIIDDAQWAN